jgi:hypothetical protein
MNRVLIVLLLLSFGSCFNAGYYNNSKELLPNQYTLYWNIEGDSIRIAIRSKSTGWVGFGIGEPTSGSMPGADILVGMVENGDAYLCIEFLGNTTIRDMYTLVKGTPVDDDCMHWKLISGEERDNYTTIEAIRKIVTNDLQDRPFEGNTARFRINSQHQPE